MCGDRITYGSFGWFWALWAPHRIKSFLSSFLSWRHSYEKRYQALSRFSVLKVTESWVGPGNEANSTSHSLYLHLISMSSDIQLITNQYSACNQCLHNLHSVASSSKFRCCLHSVVPWPHSPWFNLLMESNTHIVIAKIPFVNRKKSMDDIVSYAGEPNHTKGALYRLLLI